MLSVVEMLKKKPYQIALDLRELLKMLAMNRDKLKAKFETDAGLQ